MGLMDIFKPKHKHSDPQVRFDAVKMLNDEKTLIDIAKTDDVWQIRRIAVGKITDENVLSDIAKNDESTGVRKEAIFRINDKRVLESLFLSENSCSVLNEIRKKYDNPADLFNNLENYDIIMNRLEKFEDCHDLEAYVYDIISRINDQNLFAYLVNNTSNIRVRRYAFNNLTDFNLLLDIAEHNTSTTYYGSYRELAFKKIEQLYPDSFLNPGKVSTIDDKTQLVQIARNNINPKNRMAAIERIEDEEVLLDIIRNDSDSEVRCKAVEMIDEEELLVELARNCDDINVRMQSIRKVDDENVLIDLYRNADNWHIHDVVVEKVNDESFLIDIARNRYDDGNSVRMRAVLGIHDESALIDIYNNESDGLVRKNIVKNISDGEVLKNILLNDSCAAVRINVIRNPNFYDEEILRRIVVSDPYYKIHEKRNHEDVSLFSRQYNVRIEANKKLGGGYDRYCEESTDYDDYGAIGSC